MTKEGGGRGQKDGGRRRGRWRKKERERWRDRLSRQLYRQKGDLGGGLMASHRKQGGETGIKRGRENKRNLEEREKG